MKWTMFAFRAVLLAPLALLISVCVAPPAFAQSMGTGTGPSFGQQFGGADPKLRTERCYNHHRSPQDRLESCKRLAEEGTSVADMTTLADAYRLAGEYDHALAAITPTLNAHPDDASALGTRAVVYAITGKYDLALADSNLALASAPRDPSSYNNRCWVRAIAARELDAALADCNKSLDLKPGDAAVLDSRGLVNFKRRDMKAAIADYDAALDKSSHLASSLYMRGTARRQSGDAAGGDADIAKAKGLDPYIDSEFSEYGVTPPVGQTGSP
jgi:tetratricopeptide (TPR) repeat protein